MVPELYRGPYSKAIVDSYVSGKEKVSGRELHLREGIVIRPIVERVNLRGRSRVMLKYVSPEYLMGDY